MLTPQKIYDTGLLYHHYANTAYPLTPFSFAEYKMREEKEIIALLKHEWFQVSELCLYIHVPFCQSRCRFCEYTVLENTSEADEDQYIDLLLQEMKMYAKLVGDKPVVGYDVGGGTPLKLSVANLEKITNAARKYFNIGKDVVCSIETTPGIAARELDKLKAVRQMGYPRISMGIQTVSPQLLAELGREGEPHIYEKAIRNIRKAGFDRFNIDLMYGFLYQSDNDLETTLRYAITLKPDQITLYRNRYKGTKLESEAGGVSLYKAMRQYRLAYELLTQNGYLANVGKNTFSRHENDYGTSDYLTERVVKGTPYLGLGLGAQSFGLNYLAYNDGAASKQLKRYREKIEQKHFPIQDIYALPLEESIGKMVAVAFYFGFIDLEAFRNRFGVELQSFFKEEIKYLQEKDLMELKNGRLILTGRGSDYINGVIPLFYSKRSKEELLRLYERLHVSDDEGEKQFLAAYDINKYNRPSVATDIVAMTIRGKRTKNYRSPSQNRLSLLLIKRGEHPYMNRWALPGGFLRPGESVEHCAQRELFEETGLNTGAMHALGCFSEPGRDPRGWIISNAFLSVVPKEDNVLTYGNDAIDARWFDLEFQSTGNQFIMTFTCDKIILHAKLTISKNAFEQLSFEVNENDMAFDHAKIIATALKGLQREYGLRELAFAFLPIEFTIAELQKVHELLTGTPILTANFRRKIKPYLTESERSTEGNGHRPAQLFRRKTTLLNELQ